MKKVSLIWFSIFLISICIEGCSKIKPINNKINTNNYTTKHLEEIEKENLNPINENIRIFDDKTKYSSQILFDSNKNQSDKPLIDENTMFDVFIDDQHKQLSHKEFCELFNTLLNIEKINYRMKENLLYKYYIVNEQNKIYYDIQSNLEEVRYDEQYYQVFENIVNDRYKKEILGIKYKNKFNNEFYIGNFETRKKDKNTNLEWKEDNLENPLISRLLDLKKWNLQGIKRFYGDPSNINQNNFEAMGTMSLRQLLSFMTVRNSGINTLKDIKATPQREITKEGKTIIQTIEIIPLDLEFNYNIKVENNEIVFKTINLTETIKDYYKVFPQYNIIDAEYTLTIDLKENDNEIQNNFNTYNFNNIIATSSNSSQN